MEYFEFIVNTNSLFGRHQKKFIQEMDMTCA